MTTSHVSNEVLQLYNTYSRTKEKFHPANTPVKLYTCGPTVYNYAHIGNFRTYVFEDLLKRTLLFLGYPVRHVMNITDVDDKTIAGACEQNISLQDYTEPYTKAFFEDITTLNIIKADEYPHATHYIPQMIEATQKLIDQGIAYIGQDNSVYFSINQFDSYGKLSHLELNHLQCSSRTACDEYDKENICDFVLWKAYDAERDGNIYWESPFGKGRPGWHLECSIMSMALLGETIDIHAGGVDNIFPHHENEIAQSESLSHKPFVNYWLHSEHLLVDGKKMSKSLGNFFTLRDLLDQGFSGLEVRYMLLQSHYRMQLNFTKTGLIACRQALKRLQDFIFRLQTNYPQGIISDSVSTISQTFLATFTQSITNDLNVAVALAALFDYVHHINQLIDQKTFSKQDAEYVLGVLKQINSVLGILSFEKQEQVIPDHIYKLVQERDYARQNKDWALADTIRDQLLEQGFAIEDGAESTKIKKLSTP